MYGREVEDIIVPGDGSTIHGEVWTPGESNGRGVVLCHGYAGSRSDLYDLADRLCDEGFSVMLYDERGHGDSTDPLDIEGMARDASSAVGYLRGRLGGEKVGLFGHSMGGYVAALAESGGAGADALVTWAAPTSVRASSDTVPLARIARWLYDRDVHRYLHLPFHWYGLHTDDFGALVEAAMYEGQPDLRDRAGRIEAPYTIVHGTEDRAVLPSHARAIHEATGGRAELVWIEGGEHCLFPGDGIEDANADPEGRHASLEAVVGAFKRHLLDA